MLPVLVAGWFVNYAISAQYKQHGTTGALTILPVLIVTLLVLQILHVVKALLMLGSYDGSSLIDNNVD